MNRRIPLARTSELQPGTPPRRRTPLRSVRLEGQQRGRESRTRATTRRDTGFTTKVRLSVRTRAGNGCADDAMCECCGIWLGRYGGQVQHLVARGMGGTSNPVLGTAANAALLCGTAQTGDHGLAERRDPEMRTKGFWLPQGTDPRLVPMRLASVHGSGILVWRAEDGLGPDGTGYLFTAPEEAAA